MKGKVWILSSVAGGGKSTLIQKIMQKYPDTRFSVSCTTRPPRPGDVPGQSYHFLTIAEFEKKIAENEFLEYAKVHDNYYGTPKTFIEESVNLGKVVILDIDVQGAKSVKAKMNDASTVFILPPSEEIWIQRLKGRGTDSEEVIEKRIRNGKKELQEADWYQHRIINDELDKAFQELETLLFS
jgi:guanylate kinase